MPSGEKTALCRKPHSNPPKREKSSTARLPWQPKPGTMRDTRKSLLFRAQTGEENAWRDLTDLVLAFNPHGQVHKVAPFPNRPLLALVYEGLEAHTAVVHANDLPLDALAILLNPDPRRFAFLGRRRVLAIIDPVSQCPGVP